jgi:hypothetical protein
MDSNDREPELGYRMPPQSTRFQKGQSGNPTGRPKGRKKEPPYEAVLGQKVTIRDGGRESQVTADQAFLLHLAARGLDGDGSAARAAIKAFSKARQARAAEGPVFSGVRVQVITPGSVNMALKILSMARTLDRLRPTARLVLEPWIVEEALARLGARRLSREEQMKVVRATRTPWKVRWPEWWGVRP